MGIKHAKTSAKSDGPDSTLVQATDWNADHVGGFEDPMTTPGDLIFEGELGADLCLKGTATSDRDIPANAIDGNDSTYWAGTDQAGHWLQVDLGASLAVAAWRVLNHDSFQTFVIQSSDDETTWTTRATAGLFWDSGIVNLTYPITARYWKITSTSGSGGWWCIKTFSLFAPASAVRLPYVADGKILKGVSGVPAWADPPSGAAPATNAAALITAYNLFR